MRPSLCYTLWFTQRQGSSLLCELLASTGVAGTPGEIFWTNPEEHVPGYGASPDYAALQQAIFSKCGTPNGVIGFKGLAIRDHFSAWIDRMRQFPTVEQPDDPNPAVIWKEAFPNCRHIFLTRRNHIRLAVSWWKAIVSEEWHRWTDEERPYSPKAIAHRYDKDAIDHLMKEIAFREAAMQDFFERGQIRPLTLVYEDWIHDMPGTVRRIFEYLKLPTDELTVAPPVYQKLADELTEEWVERYRQETQASWSKVIW